MAMKLFALLLFFGAVTPATLQAQTPRADSLQTQVDQLIYRVQFDSAHRLVTDFLDRPDLTPLESYAGLYLYGRSLRAGGRAEDAIKEFEKALTYIDPSQEGSNDYRSAIRSQLAECYFDLQDFDRAAINAEAAIQLSPKPRHKTTGHAVNYLILGYVDYLYRRFTSAEERYLKAEKLYREKNLECELPLVTTKMAKLYHKLGREDIARQYLDSARHMSNLCKIPRYIYLTERTDFDLLKESGRFREALDKFDEVSEILSQFKFQEKQRELELMEASFHNRLHQVEMRQLEKVNEANEAVLAVQKRMVIILVVGVLLLLALLVILWREYRLKHSALSDLEAFRDNLEIEVAERTKNLEAARRQLEAKRDKLTSQNNRLVQLYHIMTHDLRAPLANMTMLIKFIMESDSMEEQKELVSKLPIVINSLNSNCSDLLDIIDTSAMDGEEEVDFIFFEDALLKVLRTLDSEIQAKGASISYDFKESEQVIYTGQFLESLFLNLLSNALKYAQPGRPPIIEIASKKDGDFLLLTITDNGMGLDLEKHGENLFKPRRTFHKNHDAKGYGLYMTKVQLENYGATIEMESTPGEGSTFTVRFKD